MDPINLLLAINLFVTISANFSGARKGFKISITKVVERPKTFLQKYPPNLAALILVLIIISVFKVGTLTGLYETRFNSLRIAGLVIFIVFSWIQIWSYKLLGSSYSQDIVIQKNHKIITSGIYKIIRHPQYLSQILSDLGAAIALLSYIALPFVLLLEIPLFIMRAMLEEKLLMKHFGEEYLSYKNKSGFMIPFIG
jgi:protein-S-isoprenylcysteine O-methyltransferase Ste14